MSDDRPAGLLEDWQIGKAISGILRRSDQQADQSILEKTFVDVGVLGQITNRNDQIIYGRRGTGKSHLLRVVGAVLDREPKHRAVYIDVRTLGSTQLMTDPTHPLSVRCVTVFRDLLSRVQDELLDLATDPDRPHPGSGLDEVSALAESVASHTPFVAERRLDAGHDPTRVMAETAATSTGSDNVAAVADDGPDVVEAYGHVLSESIAFADVARSLDRAVQSVGLDRLTLLLDEWGTIPADVQPFLAEFLKRTILLSPRVTLKIATLEHRSTFMLHRPGIRIGFEFGGDLSVGVDLDDYYSYSREPDVVRQTFRELLFRHMTAELPLHYLDSVHAVLDSDDLERSMFETDAFLAAVQAGEGVARDFIGIVTNAYFRAVRARAKLVTARTIELATGAWFKTDKAPNLTTELMFLLQSMVASVLDRGRRRQFLFGVDESLSRAIDSLYDFRVVHLLERGYQGQSLERSYDLYAIDYGACQALAADAEAVRMIWDDAASAGPPEVFPHA